MFKVITFNANGIRSAAQKGFFDWLRTENPDAVCIQETKAQEEQLADEIFRPLNINYYHTPQRKGKSGVALYLKEQPQTVRYGLGWPEVDCEGRYLEAVYPQFSLVSLYIHSGSSGAERQALKEEFLGRFAEFLAGRRRERLIIAGDFNIAHTERDLRNWKGNLKNSGFLPQERRWLDQLFGDQFRDGFRLVNDGEHEYSWWSNRGRARANNVGWRIDYQMVSAELAPLVRRAYIYREQCFSDHAPVVVEYEGLSAGSGFTDGRAL